MNFKQYQTFTVTTDDHQILTYTVQDITEDGRLLVQSSLLERAYFVSPKAFEDFLRVIGWRAASKYRLFFPKYQAFHAESFETFNQAVDRGLIFGYDFQVELDSMVCATWDCHEDKLVVTQEYTVWVNDQQPEEPAKYRIYLVNFGWYASHEHNTFNLAVNAGRKMGYEFRVELGKMVCATWSPLGGLRVMTEYQRWAQDQQYELARIQGEL